MRWVSQSSTSCLSQPTDPFPMRMRCGKAPVFSMRAMAMREQPTIELTSRHLRIFIGVKSTMTRIPFNLLGARMSSARCLGRKMAHLVSDWQGQVCTRKWPQPDTCVEAMEGQDRTSFFTCAAPNGGPRRKRMNRLGLGQMWTSGGPPQTKKGNPPKRESINYLILLCFW